MLDFVPGSIETLLSTGELQVAEHMPYLHCSPICENVTSSNKWEVRNI